MYKSQSLLNSNSEGQNCKALHVATRRHVGLLVQTDPSGAIKASCRAKHAFTPFVDIQ